MSAFPGTFNIQHYRGDTFQKSFAYKTAITFDDSGNPLTYAAVDMTGGTLQAQIRQTTDYAATVYADFTVENFVPAAGTWDLYIDPTTLMTVAWTTAFYDVQFTDSAGNVQTLFFGEFELTDDVTHS